MHNFIAQLFFVTCQLWLFLFTSKLNTSLTQPNKMGQKKKESLAKRALGLNLCGLILPLMLNVGCWVLSMSTVEEKWEALDWTLKKYAKVLFLHRDCFLLCFIMSRYVSFISSIVSFAFFSAFVISLSLNLLAHS